MILLSGKLNSCKDETMLFEMGDEVECVAYISKGSVIKDNGIKTYTIDEGNFICYDDLYSGFYSYDYIAMENTDIIPIPAGSAIELMQELSSNPNRHKDMSYAVCCLCKGLYDMYIQLYDIVKDFNTSLQSAYKSYVNLCEKLRVNPGDFNMPHDCTSFDLSEQAFGKNLIVLKNLAMDPEKENNLSNSSGAKYLKLQIDVINRVYIAYDDMFFYLKNMIEVFGSENPNCLFSLVAALAHDTNDQFVINLLKKMQKDIHAVDERVKSELNYNLDIDYNRVSFYFMVADHESEVNAKEMNEDMNHDINDDIFDMGDLLKNIDSSEKTPATKPVPKPAIETPKCDTYDILLQLCDYAGYDKEKYNNLNKFVVTFLNMPDKYSKENDVRLFRKSFTEAYFELYEDVFLKYATATTPNVIVKLFLDFGLLDERLVTDVQIQELLNIPSLNTEGKCAVYRMSDWLMNIYKGIEIPSKNEFDQEYSDYIRERKKNEALSPAEEKQLLNDNVGKVQFEIKNMLKYNCRLLNGNLLTFYPMLHIDVFDKTIESMRLTTESITEAIESWKQYDYSVFYREIMYTNPEQKIDKEVIQKEIYPIFVLFPVVGINGIMWQDISGKRSNSSGRFFLPALFNGSLEDTILTMLGRFRWELCKTIQGVSWNNIQVPSLTSEYIDYIQFYRKNKELTAEKKEAIKTQLTKCHNNMREFFVYDYTIWLKYESTGAMRLNKPARKMLAMYCPLAKAYRDKLVTQPIYEEAMKRFNINRLKKAKEYQTKISYYQGKCKDIPDEIIETRNYYEL